MSHPTRRGAALPAVLGALVLVALLVAAVARDVVRAERTTRLVAAAADAPAVAEVAVLRAWSAWEGWEGWALAEGATRVWSGTERGAPVQFALTRLAAHRFQLDAHAALALPTDSVRAERGQSLLLAVEPARLPWNAVVVAGGDVAGGALDMQVADTARAGEVCTGDSVPPVAVVLPPVALLQSAHPLPAASVLRDSAVGTAATYALAPPDSLAPPFQPPRELAALVAPSIAPQIGGGGECLTDAGVAPLNWGDPAWPAPCAAHVPVVRVLGDLLRPAGRAQGLLVVEGDLVLDGGYEHWGVVVVRGRVLVEGDGDRVYGALLARGGAVAVTPGAVVVRHAPCAVRAALAAAGAIRPLGGWAWREWW